MLPLSEEFFVVVKIETSKVDFHYAFWLKFDNLKELRNLLEILRNANFRNRRKFEKFDQGNPIFHCVEALIRCPNEAAALARSIDARWMRLLSVWILLASIHCSIIHATRWGALPARTGGSTHETPP